uniref:Uncharacterized protein n=1 Tax=viral metagenome TaxID=1070528 RepID=A0A6C0BZI0_9ZZZZ
MKKYTKSRTVPGVVVGVAASALALAAARSRLKHVKTQTLLNFQDYEELNLDEYSKIPTHAAHPALEQLLVGKWLSPDDINKLRLSETGNRNIGLYDKSCYCGVTFSQCYTHLDNERRENVVVKQVQSGTCLLAAEDINMFANPSAMNEDLQTWNAAICSGLSSGSTVYKADPVGIECLDICGTSSDYLSLNFVNAMTQIMLAAASIRSTIKGVGKPHYLHLSLVSSNCAVSAQLWMSPNEVIKCQLLDMKNNSRISITGQVKPGIERQTVDYQLQWKSSNFSNTELKTFSRLLLKFFRKFTGPIHQRFPYIIFTNVAIIIERESATSADNNKALFRTLHERSELIAQCNANNADSDRNFEAGSLHMKKERVAHEGWFGPLLFEIEKKSWWTKREIVLAHNLCATVIGMKI